MRLQRCITAACAAITLACTAGCVVVPFGGEHGEGGGREHEDHRGDEGEHRRDLGIGQREHLGLSLPAARTPEAGSVRTAVFRPRATQAAAPLWG
jgi:hypothetical protein